ncbi:hypothetical protein JOQ06_008869, partial [Pogonophryne albipinna]
MRGALCLVEKLVGVSLSSRPALPSAGTSALLNAIDYVMQVKAKAPPLRRRAPGVDGRKEESLANGQEPGLCFTVPAEKPFYGPFSRTLVSGVRSDSRSTDVSLSFHPSLLII